MFLQSFIRIGAGEVKFLQDLKEIKFKKQIVDEGLYFQFPLIMFSFTPYTAFYHAANHVQHNLVLFTRGLCSRVINRKRTMRNVIIQKSNYWLDEY